MTRLKILLLLVALTTAGAWYRGLAAPPKLQYITTAHQAGPVGFRDPIGAVSPDGVWLAYISNRHLFLHRIEGSSTVELLPADNTKSAVTWFPDSAHLAVQEVPFAQGPQWFRYDLATGKREPLSSPPVAASQNAKPASVAEKVWG